MSYIMYFNVSCNIVLQYSNCTNVTGGQTVMDRIGRTYSITTNIVFEVPILEPNKKNSASNTSKIFIITNKNFGALKFSFNNSARKC